MKNQLKDEKFKIEADDKSKIEAAIADGEKWFSDNADADAETFKAKTKELEDVF